MDPKDRNFTLDDSAQNLYRQFAGIDDTDHTGDREKGSDSQLMALLIQEEQMLDFYRLLLAQATCVYAGILTNSKFAAMLKDENERKIETLLNKLKSIAKFPKFDGKIACRRRGQQCPSEKEGSESYDYELSFGNFLLDYQVAKIVEERKGAKGTAMYDKLMEAFKTLNALNIFNFTLDMWEKSEEDYAAIKETILLQTRYLACEGEEDGFTVRDEYGKPSMNLTLLAAINKVKPGALQNLVDKIKPMLIGPEPHEKLSGYATVYDAIFAFKNHRSQLKKIPIEVNNVQRLVQPHEANPESSKEMVQVFRLVLSEYGDNPQMAAEVVSSINSEGYSEIKTDVMKKRLAHASSFLELAENTDKPALQEEALQNIENGLGQLPDEIYDSITIRDGEVSSTDSSGQETKWSLHDKLLGVLSFFKRRSSIKKKVQNIANNQVQFHAEDYAVIAKNFNVTELEAAHLIDLLKACFDQKGRFRRHFFDKNIPEFVQYESKVFEFLWHYLKELRTRIDRVSFLNALQPLVAKLEEPREALKILLADVFSQSPVAVRFSDRNGLILATILLHNYKKAHESTVNVEMTPEEVLLAGQGMNADMVKEAVDFFEKKHEYILQKFKLLMEMLQQAAKTEEKRTDELQPRFLMYLMRELVILLALIGGKPAQAIVGGVVQEFGNPGSMLYKSLNTKENMRHALQLLQVASRSLRRFNDPQNDSFLDSIVHNEREFAAMLDDPSHAALVKRVMDRIESG